MNSTSRNGRADRLVDCAKSSFASRGYYGSSISQMAQQAGIARATFYQYFDNKLHIFESILDSFVTSLRECITPVSLAPAPLRLWSRFRTILRGSSSWF